MRYFDEAGLSALWGIAGINFFASIVALPIALMRREINAANIKWLLIICAGMGLSNIFYFAGLILSDVIRVTFLFYLLPIWATLFSKLLYGVPIGPIRGIALVFAVGGIWLLLGDGGLPIPQNLGDLFGLLSGMGWAFGLTVIRGHDNLGGFATAAGSLIFATLTAVILGSILSVTSPDIQLAFPSLEVWSGLIIPVALFGILLLWPTVLAQVWGAQFVAAVTAALLTMSEIVVATISTTVLEGNTLSLLSWIGGGLILISIFINLYAGQDG